MLTKVLLSGELSALVLDLIFEVPQLVPKRFLRQRVSQPYLLNGSETYSRGNAADGTSPTLLHIRLD